MKNFKKVAIFICAILISLLSACNKAAETKEVKEPETISKVTEVNEENILLKMEEANTRDALMKNHDKIGYVISDIFSNGETKTEYTYQDKDKFICIWEDGEEKYTAIDRAGEIVEYKWSTKEYCTYVLVGEDAYEEFKKSYYLVTYGYDPLRKVTSMKESGDRLIVEAEVTDAEFLAGVAESYQYDKSEVVKETYYYEIDANTYEIYKMFASLHLKDGSTAEIWSDERTDNYDECLSSEALEFDISSLEKRKYTLIENPGTPEEIKHEYLVPSGIRCDEWLSSEYEQALYLDPDFKVKNGSDQAPSPDYTKDFTGYIRKASN